MFTFTVPISNLRPTVIYLTIFTVFVNLSSKQVFQTGKYIVRAEDLPRANILPCAQRPVKRAKFEKYTYQVYKYLQKGTITYAEALRG